MFTTDNFNVQNKNKKKWQCSKSLNKKGKDKY